MTIVPQPLRSTAELREMAANIATFATEIIDKFPQLMKTTDLAVPASLFASGGTEAQVGEVTAELRFQLNKIAVAMESVKGGALGVVEATNEAVRIRLAGEARRNRASA